MRMIDEKGRLFGKLNIIDFLVIVFLLCILPAFYFAYKLANQKPIVPTKTFTEVELYCRIIKLTPSFAQMISVGDKEVDEEGNATAEIIRLDKIITPYVYEFDIGEGVKITKEDPFLKQVAAKLKVKAETRENGLYYKSRQIMIGSILEFKTDKYSLTAIVEPEEDYEECPKERTLDLDFVFKDLEGDILKKISVGDKELDESGNTIMEIVDLGKIENMSFEFSFRSGNFILAEDSSKKQVYAKVRLKGELKDKQHFYFKGKRIEQGFPIEFKTSEYTINAFIAKSFEKNPIVEENRLLLQVKFSGVVPEIAAIIQKSDVEKDPFGEIMARIRSVVSNNPAQVLALNENKFISLQHPFNKDILIILEVKSLKKDGVCYFKNYPVKIGNIITFVTDLYSVSGTIVGVEIQ